MVKGLHKSFEAVVNELQNALPTLEESGSEVSHFISEPRNFSEVRRLPVNVKKYWLKATIKYNKNLISNQKLIMDEPEKGDTITSCMDVYKTNVQSDVSIDKLKFKIVARGQNK